MWSLPGGCSAEALMGQCPFMPTAKLFIWEVKWVQANSKLVLPLNCSKAGVQDLLSIQAAPSQGLLAPLGNADAHSSLLGDWCVRTASPQLLVDGNWSIPQATRALKALSVTLCQRGRDTAEESPCQRSASPK